MTAPTSTINGSHAAQSNLDEQKLAARVKDLTTSTVIRPALIDPAEVETARKKFVTPSGTLTALEKMAEIRLAWLNQRDGLKSGLALSNGQKESALAFFTSHNDKPLSAPVESPKAVEPVKPDPNYALVSILASQARLLARMADTLDQIVANTAPAAPNYRKPYDDFKAFEWATIGAVITNKDGDGVSAVEWNGYDFTRRAGVGKYGKAIWFSRPTGKDAEGNNLYVRLITFKDYTEAEPLPKK